MAPSMHPQAKFDPIPPDLDLHDLVDKTPNFNWVKRISAAQIRNIGQREFEKLVLFHVIQGGKPLVIEKWNDRLPKSLFGVAWLESHYDKRRKFRPAARPRHLRRTNLFPQRRTFVISMPRPTSQ